MKHFTPGSGTGKITEIGDASHTAFGFATSAEHMLFGSEPSMVSQLCLVGISKEFEVIVSIMDSDVPISSFLVDEGNRIIVNRIYSLAKSHGSGFDFQGSSPSAGFLLLLQISFEGIDRTTPSCILTVPCRAENFNFVLHVGV